MLEQNEYFDTLEWCFQNHIQVLWSHYHIATTKIANLVTASTVKDQNRISSVGIAYEPRIIESTDFVAVPQVRIGIENVSPSVIMTTDSVIYAYTVHVIKQVNYTMIFISISVLINVVVIERVHRYYFKKLFISYCSG